MSHRQRHALSIVFGLLLLGGLAFTTLQAGWPPQVDVTAWLLFTAPFVFTNTFGFPLGGGSVNLVPVATVGGLLVLGPLAATWMVLVGSILQALVRWAYAPSWAPRGSLAVGCLSPVWALPTPSFCR